MNPRKGIATILENPAVSLSSVQGGNEMNPRKGIATILK